MDISTQPAVNILLVDDHPANLLALEAILDSLDENLVKAGSGDEALQQLLNHDFAVVLLDIQMKGMDGFETAKLIRTRERSRHTPIIFVTAHDNSGFPVAEAYALGAVDYLVKPLVPVILRSKVAVFVDLFKMSAQVKWQAERLKAEAESNMRLIVESVKDFAIFSVDVKGRVSTWNAGAERLFGWSEAEIIGQNFALIFIPEDRAQGKPERELRDAAEKSRAVDDRWHLRKDGRRFFASGMVRPIRDEAGVLQGFTKVARDVTERKQAEDALRMSEARFRTLADNAPVMIWWAGTDKLCTYFNKPWLDFTGRTLKQELGNGWADGIHVEDYELALCTYVRTFDAREPFQMEFRLRQHDGQYRWVLNHGLPLFSPEGDFTGYIGSAIDITDRKKTEEALKDADRRKNEFLAMLSHELRNPLAAIRNALQLSRRPGMEEHFEWAKDVVDRQTRHLVHLIDDLLDVSRISRGKIQLRMEHIDVTTTISRAVDATRPFVEERKHKLTVSFAPTPLRVRADPTRLEQIIVNLLSNSTKYMEEGGEIWLTVDLEGCDVIIWVRDTGIGIPPEKLPHVFELFTQIDSSIERSSGGLGIRLSLVQSLVTLHGGSVTAESEGPGKGSTFTVRLPSAVGEDLPRERQHKTVIEISVPGRRRILVIDDNLDSAKGMSKLLKSSGQEVEMAHDGRAALEAARRFSPDIVLLDIGLPELDGYQVAETLRNEGNCRNAILIAVSGYAQEEDRDRSRKAGFDHHLAKPVDYESVLALITEPGSPA